MDCVPIYVLYNVWFVCELLCALHIRCMWTVSSFLQPFICIECMCLMCIVVGLYVDHISPFWPLQRLDLSA